MSVEVFVPTLGLFTSPDSFAFPAEEFGMNRYMYAKGNPVNFNDPTGHRSHWPLAPGHMWTGNGNADYLSSYHEAINDEFAVDRDNLTIYDYMRYPQLVFLKPPEPTSPMDRVALRHDREVPGVSFMCGDSLCRAKMKEANKHFIKGSWDNIRTGRIWTGNWRNSVGRYRGDSARDLKAAVDAVGAAGVDLLAAGIGSLAFAVENLYYDVTHFRESRNRHGEFWKEQTGGFEYKVRNEWLIRAYRDGGLPNQDTLKSIAQEEAIEIWENYMNYEFSNFCSNLAGYQCW